MSTPSRSPPTTRDTQPTILLLSLSKEPYWDEQYSSLVNHLSSHARLKRVTNPNSALTHITGDTNTDIKKPPPPTAILITDAALTEPKPKYNGIRQAVVKYARDGGTVVIGTHFTSFVKPNEMNRWFSTSWGLDWQGGDYHRTTVHANGACAAAGRLAGLPTSYSQKAIFLKHVAQDAALYLPSDESRVESHVFAPSSVDGRQTPVAFTKVGDGWLGYVGDVNGETESNIVIAAMCGL